MQQPQNRKPLLFFLAGLVVLYVGYATIHTILNNRYTTLNVVLVPRDATFTLDDKKKAYKQGSVKVSAGQHTLTISREGFTNKTVTATTTHDTATKVQVALVAKNTTGEDYLKHNQADAIKGEDIGGTEIVNGAAALAKKYPILGRLPVTGQGYSVDVGRSKRTPPSDLALYVQCWRPVAYCQDQVAQWMASQGYRAADYEIVYVNNNNN